MPKRNNTDVKTSLSNLNDNLEKPTFINKNLNNKQTNFVELNKEGDVILNLIFQLYYKNSIKNKENEEKEAEPIITNNKEQDSEKFQGFGNKTFENHKEFRNSNKNFNYDRNYNNNKEHNSYKYNDFNQKYEDDIELDSKISEDLQNKLDLNASSNENNYYSNEHYNKKPYKNEYKNNYYEDRNYNTSSNGYYSNNNQNNIYRKNSGYKNEYYNPKRINSHNINTYIDDNRLWDAVTSTVNNKEDETAINHDYDSNKPKKIITRESENREKANSTKKTYLSSGVIINFVNLGS